MLRITTLLVVVLATAACTTPAPNSKTYLHQGVWELEGSASLTNTDDDNTDTTAFDINSTMSYSVNDQLQIGPLLIVDVEHTEFDGSDLSIDRDLFGLGPNIRFNFPIENSPVLPFVEGAVGLFYADVDVDGVGGGDTSDDDTGPFFQLGGGTRFLLSDHASINVVLRYRCADVDKDLGGSQDQFGIFAGLALTF